ncbi:MAG: hypothetical protein PCFJNLEI_01609 [Verrucomicrobiae bacterium]|nr:hypothetical protein [Verrucomicrobiae bacterium]
MMAAIQKVLQDFFTYLFGVKLLESRCTSITEARRYTLAREYLDDSQALEIKLQVRWPRIGWPRRNQLEFVLSNQEGRGVHEGWEVTTREQSTEHGSVFTIVIAGAPVVRESGFVLRVICRDNGRTVEELRFQCVDRAALAKEILIHRATLVARFVDYRVECNRVHDQVAQLEYDLEWSLPNAEHRQLLTEMGLVMSLELASVGDGASSIASWSYPVSFPSDRCSWSEKIGSSGIFRHGAGDYIFRVRLANQLIKSNLVQVTDFDTYQAAVRAMLTAGAIVRESNWSVVDRHGKVVPLDVVAEDSRTIDAVIQFELPTPDPLLPQENLLIALTVSRDERTPSVSHQVQSIPAWGGSSPRHQLSIPITPTLLQHGPGRYEITIHLENRLLAQTAFTHKTRQQIRQEKTASILDGLVVDAVQIHVLRDGETQPIDGVIFATDEAILPKFAVEGHGFDEDVPMVAWRLRVVLLNEDTGQSIATDVNFRTKPGKNVCNGLKIPLRTEQRWLLPGHWRLRLEKQQTRVAEVKLQILAEDEIVPYTQQLVLQNLRAEGQELHVLCSGRRYQSEIVADSCDAVIPQLTLRAAGFNRFLPEVPVVADVHLSGGVAGLRKIAQLQFVLRPEPVRLPKLVVQVRGTELAEDPGLYRLIIRISEREITSFPFHVASATEVLEQVTVTKLVLNAQTKRGSSVRNSVTLSVAEHRSIAPALEVGVGILAPNVVCAASLLLLEDDQVLMQTDFDVPLDAPVKRFKSARIQLQMLRGDEQRRERRFTLVTLIGSIQKEQLQFTLVCSEILANFEGQLMASPDQLQVDDNEYQEILRRL